MVESFAERSEVFDSSEYNEPVRPTWCNAISFRQEIMTLMASSCHFASPGSGAYANKIYAPQVAKSQVPQRAA